MTTADRYRALLERLDAWFAAARRKHGSVIPCKLGCSACCYGPFDISTADMLLIQGAFERLPSKVRAEVLRRARAQVEEAREVDRNIAEGGDVGRSGDRHFDKVCDALAKQPCPLLDDAGRCRIYADRPLVCRMMGLPMRAGKRRVIGNACPIRHSFPDYAKLPPQPFPLATFEREEEEIQIAAALELFGAGGESRAASRTFIAAWLASADMR